MKNTISIVIPAYNEARVLPVFLDRLSSYCNGNKIEYEIILVDDGSTDDTFNIASSYKGHFPRFDIVRLKKNRGKGYAVKTGLLKAGGDICLFLDADGSTEPEEIGRNLHYLTDGGYDIFVGSRVIREKDRVLTTKWYRKAIGSVFNFFVQLFLFKEVKDTQCGFKMFKRQAVGPIFSRSYIEGFGFDPEILHLAYKMGYKVKEGAVSWHHVDGSKVNLFLDSIKMFINILQVRIWHCTPINIFDKNISKDEYRYMYEMEDSHWWFVSRRNLVTRLMKSFGISYPTILDVGSGTGRNLLEFNRLGMASGIDISRHAIEFSKKRGLKDVIQCPIEKITYAPGSFDIITCLDVLEHISKPIEVLMELRRIMKDNGRLVITVPAFKMLWSRHDEIMCHFRRYERHALIKDIQEAGLEVEKIGYFFFASFFAVALIRISRRFILGKQKLRSDSTTLPPLLLNEILKFIFKLEMMLSDRISLPFGTTLYAIASKE